MRAGIAGGSLLRRRDQMEKLSIKREVLDKILDRYELTFSQICTCRGDWEDFCNVKNKKDFMITLINHLKRIGITITEPDHLARAREYKEASERLMSTLESLDLKDGAIKHYEKHITQLEESKSDYKELHRLAKWIQLNYPMAFKKMMKNEHVQPVVDIVDCVIDFIKQLEEKIKQHEEKKS
jgi:hypothetical protein